MLHRERVTCAAPLRARRTRPRPRSCVDAGALLPWQRRATSSGRSCCALWDKRALRQLARGRERWRRRRLRSSMAENSSRARRRLGRLAGRRRRLAVASQASFARARCRATNLVLRQPRGRTALNPLSLDSADLDFPAPRVKTTTSSATARATSRLRPARKTGDRVRDRPPVGSPRSRSAGAELQQRTGTTVAPSLGNGGRRDGRSRCGLRDPRPRRPFGRSDHYAPGSRRVGTAVENVGAVMDLYARLATSSTAANVPAEGAPGGQVARHRATRCSRATKRSASRRSDRLVDHGGHQVPVG